MSHQPISRNPDLAKLRDAGYNIYYKDSHLVVWDIPYLNAQGELERGQIICPADLQNDQVAPPSAHWVWFSGNHPHGLDGIPLAIVAGGGGQGTAIGISWQHMLSIMRGGQPLYPNWHRKLLTYIVRISSPATEKFGVTAATRQPIIADDTESVFVLQETWSSRAGIADTIARLKGLRLGIVGIGGTGAHILDLVSKTPVAEIHIFDADIIRQHNIWRLPGAVGPDALNKTKVEYFAKKYSNLRRHIIDHQNYIDENNLTALNDLDFVFLAVDSGSARRLIAAHLHAQRIPFIDVGQGLYSSDDGTIAGLVRTTLVTPDMDLASISLPYDDGDPDALYKQNIQTVDMNSLNAAFAVILWKKHALQYAHIKKETHGLYTIATNKIANAPKDNDTET